MTAQADQREPVFRGEQVSFLIATAARAPSVHNTQPWLFKPSPDAIELYADQGRKILADPSGREMLISCGAALFGLRLAIRSLGYLPAVDLLPDPARPSLLARVRPGAQAPITAAERAMLLALPHRHTHRGGFDPQPLPPGLLPRLQHDARAEGAALVIIHPGLDYQRLDGLVNACRSRDDDPVIRAEIRRWTRPPGSLSLDGIPAQTFPARPATQRGRLRQRDFDLGRGTGSLPAGGSPPAVTAAVVTSADDRADWLRAGQALHRLLAHAATSWVFASLYSQPLETAEIRALIRDRLALPGAPQMLLQLGVARSTRPTPRRPPAALAEP